MFSSRSDTLDLTGTLNDAAAALVDDSFLRCFKSAVDHPWNWNFYLFPLWCCGVVVRNLILFPIRVLTLIVSFLLFIIGFGLASVLPVRTKERKKNINKTEQLQRLPIKLNFSNFKLIFRSFFITLFLVIRHFFIYFLSLFNPAFLIFLCRIIKNGR